MPDLTHYIRRALTRPPHETVAKAVRIFRRALADRSIRRRDVTQATYADSFPVGGIHSYTPSLRGLDPPEWLAPVTARFMKHRFDLLGSGWTSWGYDDAAPGVEGHSYHASVVTPDAQGDWLGDFLNVANVPQARRIWDLVSQDYDPIDWHRDMKSGYRWHADAWYREIEYGSLAGMDVKIPWELARGQHMPLLAWAYAASIAGREGFEPTERYQKEFRDAVLDFTATNPPRCGVNWVCTMDVAIRSVNHLLAFDLFRAAGAVFDDEFEKVLSRSALEHGRHIVTNLEWSPDLRANHYLADVCGLLIIAAYLPRTRETDAWLAFAVQELVSEVKHQFNPDGSGFEASTAYHRLSAEMVVYVSAYLLGLSDDKREALRAYDPSAIEGPVPLKPGLVELDSAWLAERLERMAFFAMDVTKSDGRIVQIGDNDSGRFVALGRSFDEDLREDHLDLRHLVAAVVGLASREEFVEFAGVQSYETVLVRGIAQGRTLEPTGALPEAFVHPAVEGAWEKMLGRLGGIEPDLTRTVEFEAPCGLRDGLETVAYPDFGLFIMRSPRVWLSVRCGSIGQDGNGGHAHNDQLAVELVLDGEPLLTDPGTYLYTPLPHCRDEYRSVMAHAAPRVEGREPGDLSLGLFQLGDKAQAFCAYFGERGFVGSHQGYGAPVWRMVELLDDRVRIVDWSEGDPLTEPVEPPPFSRGYGWREDT